MSLPPKINRRKFGTPGVGVKPKKKRPIKTGRPVGRPNDYREGYAGLCRDLRMLGLGLERIAFVMKLPCEKLMEWRKTIPEFGSAWDEGSEHADAGVARSVYQRAMGYSHTAEEIVYDRGTGAFERANYTKHYPPDTAAAKFWLTNRHPDLWQDKSASEITGKDGQPLMQPPTLVFVPVEVKEVKVVEVVRERIEEGSDKSEAEDWMAEKGMKDAAD